MRIAIIGTGGVGGYFGGLLARAGNDVTFVARGDNFQALKSGGLQVESVVGNFVIQPVAVVERINELKSPELVLFTTKTYDRDSTAAELAKVTVEETAVIPLLNGLDNDHQIAKALTKGSVYPGVTFIVAARIAPGIISQTAGPRTLIFGDRQNPDNGKLKHVEHVMRQAEILATLSPNIEHDLWEKFVWIAVFSGMTGLYRSSIGAIVNDDFRYQQCLSCLDEALSIAEAEKVKLDPEIRERVVKKLLNYRTVATAATSSLQIDLESKRRTEIEDLTGTLLRLAAKVGISCPVNESIYRAINS